MILWRKLSAKERIEAKRWARENYKPYHEIKGTWHPITQAECVRININHDSGTEIEPIRIKVYEEEL